MEELEAKQAAQEIQTASQMLSEQEARSQLAKALTTQKEENVQAVMENADRQYTAAQKTCRTERKH